MPKSTKNLRRPIHTTINGHPCTMLTIGHLALALGRTPWSVKRLIKVGLIPPATCLERPDTPNLRRRLWPAQFVAAMRVIGKQDYMAVRLDRKDWDRFQQEVEAAYRDTIEPLLDSGVTGVLSSSPLAESGQGNGR